MNNKVLLIAMIPTSIILGLCFGIFKAIYTPNNIEVSNNTIIDKTINSGETITSGEIIYSDNTQNNIAEEKSDKHQNLTPDTIKAVYSTGWVAGSKSLRETMIKNITDNNFNAIVLDIKDEAGHLSYNSTVQTAIDIKASQNMIKDISAVIKEYHENGIYVIGRIVTFKDPTYAKAVKDIAYKKADGSSWTDSAGNYWPNPYDERTWDYPIELAKEAANLGFDEIQFDYIRFPSSEGRVKQIVYGFDSATTSKSKIINKFLTKVMDEMAEYNVKISADVFGIITKRDGDFENIGQDYKAISQIVDIICPMVYPSHYGDGEYKIAKPDLNPYGIIYGSISDAFERISGDSNVAEIRPYLQDFTASWLGKGNYQSYGSQAVKDQIQACYDLGVDSFTLWDPSNKYCYDALSLIENKSGE